MFFFPLVLAVILCWGRLAFRTADAKASFSTDHAAALKQRAVVFDQGELIHRVDDDA